MTQSLARPPPSHLGCVQRPFARNAFQRSSSSGVEAESGARDEVLDDAGNEHLAGLGLGGYAGPDVDGDAAQIVARALALARVYPGAHLQPERPNGVLHSVRTPDRACRAVKRGEKAVTGRVDLLAAPARESPRRTSA